MVNQAAGRLHRKEVLHFLKKNFQEYLDSKDPQKDMEVLTKKVEETAENLERNYVQLVGNDDNFPVFDFEINLNDGE